MNADLTTRYPSCSGFTSELSNIWNHYYKIKKTNSEDSNLMQKI